MKEKNSKECSRKGCKSIANVFYSDRSYCNMCNRIRTMRSAAQQKGKTKPSTSWFIENWPRDMICPVKKCGKKMVFRGSPGMTKDSISLQHNNDGKMMLICTQCNSGHSNSALGDKYFDLDRTERFCAGCKKIKHKSQFCSNRAQPGGMSYRCKTCR